MNKDLLDFLDTSSSNNSSDVLDFLESPTKNKIEKPARLAAQYAIGNIERAALPYDIAVSPLESKKAQMGEYRKNIFEDIERLSEQKQTGVWDQQDESLLQNLIEQIKSPEKTKQFIKTADLSSSNLIEKTSKKLGYDISPQGIEEHTARIGGNVLSPKTIAKGAKYGVKYLASKETRQAIKTAKNWKALERSAKGNAEKEGMLNFAKEHSLTPEEATLLMRSSGKGEILEKLSKKTKKFKETVQSLKNKLGKNYEELKNLGKEEGYLSGKQKGELQGDLQKVLNEIDKTFVEGPDTKSARIAIEEAINKIGQKEGTIKDLINSRQGLKEGINWKNIDKGDVLLKKADKAFLEAIRRKSPEIAKRLEGTDAAYAKFKRFEKLLNKKSQAIKIKGIEIPGFLNNVAFGAALKFTGLATPAVLKGVAVKEGAQRLATLLVTNPKFQAPLKNLQHAILNGSAENQKNVFLIIKKMVQKEDPDLYEEIKDFNVE